MSSGQLPQSVPYGYEPPKDIKKGTLFFYDAFEDIGRQELEQALRHSKLNGFADLVLYPIHIEE
ncbi:hypothetical protein ACFOQM_03115 [Paenibacillus sp. GCM10012307]|uniref:Uncharacterized protein n=1 Tax=Paenibacillus roseus TaxID=2798579 RepID=A0A934J4Q7_9BACL|nr:hypothetical protein [Paenibacillus roseus]MBJ6360307.1 hypothetical protein [Paenibacillus roseus]